MTVGVELILVVHWYLDDNFIILHLLAHTNDALREIGRCSWVAPTYIWQRYKSAHSGADDARLARPATERRMVCNFGGYRRFSRKSHLVTNDCKHVSKLQTLLYPAVIKS